MVDGTSPTAVPEQPRFAVERCLPLSFGVLGRNFGSIALVTLVITATRTAIDFALGGGAIGGESRVSLILGVITYALITTPLTYITFQDLRGARVGTSEMMSRGFRRVGRVIGMSVAVGLIMVVPMAVALAISTIAPTLAYLCLAVAGLCVLYIVVIFFAAVPVQVMETSKFGSGFSRALALSRGRRWGILGLLLIYGVLLGVFRLLVRGVTASVADFPAIALLLDIPLGAFSSAIGAILPAVVYYLLRAEKEGVGIDEIAKVFD